MKDTSATLINAEPPEKSPLTKRMLRAGHEASLPRAIRRLFQLNVGRRQRRDQWGSKAMRRGVQISKAARQLPARLAFIHKFQRQGIRLAAESRAAYVQRRGVRWREIVEKNAEPMFQQALSDMMMGGSCTL